jgi:hypothetical protein
MKNINPFRLKHKATGLYYIPLRQIRIPNSPDGEGGWIKSNLSERGKIYFSDPRKHISEVEDHTNLTYQKINNSGYEPKSKPIPATIKVVPEDFEIEYLSE